MCSVMNFINTLYTNKIGIIKKINSLQIYLEDIYMQNKTVLKFFFLFYYSLRLSGKLCNIGKYKAIANLHTITHILYGCF